MDEFRKIVEALAQQAGRSTNALAALQFSQAACNVANAMAQLVLNESKDKIDATRSGS